jgi:hypothetical protein
MGGKIGDEYRMFLGERTLMRGRRRLDNHVLAVCVNITAL